MLTPTTQLRRQALTLITLAAFAAAPAAAIAYPSGPIRGLTAYPSGPIAPTLVRSAPALDRGLAVSAHKSTLPAAGCTASLGTVAASWSG